MTRKGGQASSQTSGRAAVRARTSPADRFALPGYLPRGLAEILSYWNSLNRNDNPIPLWSQVRLTALLKYSDALMMIDVLESPDRFRFGMVGRGLVDRYGADVESHFVADIAARAPFEDLQPQCCATIRTTAPTFYHHPARKAGPSEPALSYQRLLLPLWGAGHVEMLLGAAMTAD